MAPSSKPETVLKQAEGLVSVGQSHAALQSLTDMFSSKRFRSTPLASLEPIMLRFVELCVDMRKGRTAKEGLMQYKNIAQNASVASIEVVIKRFVQLADQKVQEAQEKADKVSAGAVKGTLEDVDDLEATETPESILLGAVSGDQSKDRTDRALVTPWLKFLWESYRTALETLKNNARLEAIYQQIAQQAFKFCLKHSRKVEFRRLCETIRLHLSTIAKYAHQPHAINLSDPDTLQRHLDTRFAQLSAAVELELWQEAFRSVEDVHNLLTMAKKAPRPSMMAGYYEKLTKIFLMSGNALYHAAAWNRFYAIVRSNPSAHPVKPADEEELSKLAGIVLVSALAVPLHADQNSVDPASSGRVSRLTALLGLSKTPTRAGLLASALASTMPTPLLKLVPAPVQALYDLLETSFDPLELCSSAAPVLKELEEIQEGIYQPYVAQLRDAILGRLLGQLGQVYDSINLLQVHELVAPIQVEGAGHVKVEGFIVAAAKRGEIPVQIDHATGVLYFTAGLFTSSSSDGASTSANTLDDVVQPSSADIVQTRLSTLATVLSTSLSVLFSPPPPTTQLASLLEAVEAERKSLAIKRALIVRRRELHLELTARQEKEEQGRKAEASRKEKDEEAKRAIEEVRKREIERARREVENIKKEEARQLAQNLSKRGNLKVDIDNMENLNTDSLMKLQVEQLEKEKRETSERLRIISKRIDHLERAYRKEERPLLAEDYAHQQAEDLAVFQASAQARREAARLAHDADLQNKARLGRMMDDYINTRGVMAGKRGEEFARKREAANRKIEEEKSARRKAIAKSKEEERKKREEEEKKRKEEEEAIRKAEEERLAEEARKAAEEEARLQEIEAAKRKVEEEREQKRAQREQERKEAEEFARKQRIREEEAEERKKRAKLEASTATARPRPSLFGADRDREAPADAWRRPERPGSISATPTPPPGSPSRRADGPTAAPTAPPRFAPSRGGAAGAAGGGWRARAAAKEAGVGGGAPPASTPPRVASPSPRPPPPAKPASPTPPGGDDGFQTVPKKGRYVPPSRR
ncbi:hypothetical protein SISNIDRAFT_419271 [Sistotremastrum niveocremeum HHB9708]|uniref:Eukaryotic translation initiation factor 3 subunit A n=1 Tax=Sistotremastrum niveocremeum HHB9708 TaxID=1314777 RepID=A0A164NGT0_9AGAM|nr:hypothetical protein SISNIDRAFT_419271 [Sistotremastrum niveocremeum HHB9708]